MTPLEPAGEPGGGGQVVVQPTYDREDDFLWTPDYGRQVDRYYGVPTYW